MEDVKLIIKLPDDLPIQYGNDGQPLPNIGQKKAMIFQKHQPMQRVLDSLCQETGSRMNSDEYTLFHSDNRTFVPFDTMNRISLVVVPGMTVHPLNCIPAHPIPIPADCPVMESMCRLFGHLYLREVGLPSPGQDSPETQLRHAVNDDGREVTVGSRGTALVSIGAAKTFRRAVHMLIPPVAPMARMCLTAPQHCEYSVRLHQSEDIYLVLGRRRAPCNLRIEHDGSTLVTCSRQPTVFGVPTKASKYRRNLANLSEFNARPNDDPHPTSISINVRPVLELDVAVTIDGTAFDPRRTPTDVGVVPGTVLTVAPGAQGRDQSFIFRSRPRTVGEMLTDPACQTVSTPDGIPQALLVARRPLVVRFRKLRRISGIDKVRDVHMTASTTLNNLRTAARDWLVPPDDARLTLLYNGAEVESVRSLLELNQDVAEVSVLAIRGGARASTINPCNHAAPYPAHTELGPGLTIKVALANLTQWRALGVGHDEGGPDVGRELYDMMAVPWFSKYEEAPLPDVVPPMLPTDAMWGGAGVHHTERREVAAVPQPQPKPELVNPAPVKRKAPSPVPPRSPSPEPSEIGAEYVVQALMQIHVIEKNNKAMMRQKPKGYRPMCPAAGYVQFLVKWQGYRELTWEPEWNLAEGWDHAAIMNLLAGKKETLVVRGKQQKIYFAK